MGHDNGEICGVIPCVPFLIVFSNSCADLSQHGCMGGLNIKMTPINNVGLGKVWRKYALVYRLG